MTVQLEDPDIEALLIAYVSAGLVSAGFTGVGVSDRYVAGTEHVAVYVVGGARRDLVTGQPMVVVDACAGTNTRASAICRRVHALLHDLWSVDLGGGVMVYDVTDVRAPSSDPRYPDVNRYSCTVSIAAHLASVA